MGKNYLIKESPGEFKNLLEAITKNYNPNYEVDDNV